MTQIEPQRIADTQVGSAPTFRADPPPAQPPPQGRAAAAKVVRRLGDRIFEGLSTGSGTLILIILALVAAFLVAQGIPALTARRRTCPTGARSATCCRWRSAPSGRRSWRW